MLNVNNRHRPTGKSLLTLAATVAISLVALIYFLPRESKFG